MTRKNIQRRSRRGNYGTLFGLTLPVLLGGAAVAVDLSYQKVVYAQLQAVAAPASSTGAAYPDGPPAGGAPACVPELGLAPPHRPYRPITPGGA